MGVAVVPGDDDVVPLVVIQGAVTIAFDHIGAVSEVKHVVYVPVRNHKHPMTWDSLEWFKGNVYITGIGGFKSPKLDWHHAKITKAWFKNIKIISSYSTRLHFSSILIESISLTLPSKNPETQSSTADTLQNIRGQHLNSQSIMHLFFGFCSMFCFCFDYFPTHSSKISWSKNSFLKFASMG